MRRGTRRTTLSTAESIGDTRKSELPLTLNNAKITNSPQRRRRRQQRPGWILLQFRSFRSLLCRNENTVTTVLRDVMVVTALLLLAFCLLAPLLPLPRAAGTGLFIGRKRNLEISILAAKAYSVAFPNPLGSSVVTPVRPMGHDELVLAKYRDDGGLQIHLLEDMTMRNLTRAIYHDFKDDRGYSVRGPKHDDSVEYYYNFDDDAKRDPLIAYDDHEIHKTKRCRRTSWHRDLPINCNNLHEFDIQGRFRGGDMRYLGHGGYREVYSSNFVTAEPVVFKTFYWGSSYNYEEYEFMRMDAIVTERLTWSPRIVDIFGFCGSSMLNEAMVNGDLEKVAVPAGTGRLGHALNDKEHLDVRNNLTATKKLEYALDMAEAVLVLHSFPDGVIVHDDIQLSQYLLSPDGTLRLNDFNRAEIMLFNEKNQVYCSYRNNPGNGDWRAPEEYFDKPLYEQIDIWSLGNNMYSLLTGVSPFYEVANEEIVKEKIMKGETGYIDPRYKDSSFAEARLAEIIPLCWVYDPAKRIDIFYLVEFLRASVKENRILEESKIRLREKQVDIVSKQLNK